MIAGIDPGVSGAVAFYTPDSGALAVHDLPTHRITVAGHKRAVLDYYQLGDLLERHALALELAVIEAVNAMPATRPARGGKRAAMGVTGAFRFGEVFGALQMGVALCDVPVELVRPAAWKRVMRLKADKDAARQRASQLFPAYARQWARVCDHDRAEAVLLAVFGHRLLEQRQ